MNISDEVLVRLWRCESIIENEDYNEFVFINNITHFLGLEQLLFKVKIRSFFIVELILNGCVSERDVFCDIDYGMVSCKNSEVLETYNNNEFDYEGRWFTEGIEYFKDSHIISKCDFDDIVLDTDGSILKYSECTCHYGYIGGVKRLIAIDSKLCNEYYFYDNNGLLYKILSVKNRNKEQIWNKVRYYG